MTALVRVAAVASLASAAFIACGGNVVVDETSAAGGSGGSATVTTTSTIITTTGTGATGTTTSTVTTGTGATGTTTTTVTTGTGGTGGSGCESVGDCPTCCVENNQDAYGAYVSLVLKFCACSPMQQCQKPCTLPGENACADPFALGQACIDCINQELENGNSCGQDAQDTCQQQPFCAPLFNCLLTCP